MRTLPTKLPAEVLEGRVRSGEFVVRMMSLLVPSRLGMMSAVVVAGNCCFDDSARLCFGSDVNVEDVALGEVPVRTQNCWEDRFAVAVVARDERVAEVLKKCAVELVAGQTDVLGFVSVLHSDRRFDWENLRSRCLD